MLASACSTRSQQSTAGQAAGPGVFWNALIRREIYFPIARHRGAVEGRMGGAGAAGIGICGYSLENARTPLIPKVQDSGIFMLPSEAEASSLTAVPRFRDRASPECGGGAEWAGPGCCGCRDLLILSRDSGILSRDSVQFEESQ